MMMYVLCEGGFFSGGRILLFKFKTNELDVTSQSVTSVINYIHIN